MKLLAFAALGVVIFPGSSALSQPRPISLCIVDTKSNAADQYEPSAGPYAIAMYKQLAQLRLKNGIALHVTVLAASMQQEVLPDHRLNCSWVLQLWYHRSADATNILSGPVGDQDSLLFAL